MALANFLKIKTVSDAGVAIDASNLVLYKNGVAINSAGFVFTGFNTSGTKDNVFSVAFGKEIDFDEYSFFAWAHMGNISSYDFLISNDGVTYDVVDSHTTSKGTTNKYKITFAPVVPTQTIDQMISDAFVSAKTYIDAKDAGLKAYTDSALTQLMNTTDITAKLALLEQINSILDGDAATAGFQAWQSALTRLNAIETTASDFKTQTESALQNINDLRITAGNVFTAKIDANKATSDSVDAALAERVLTLETTTHSAVTTSIATLDTKVTTSVATVQTGINANFAAMKAKAAILFAV